MQRTQQERTQPCNMSVYLQGIVAQRIRARTEAAAERLRIARALYTARTQAPSAPPIVEAPSATPSEKQRAYAEALARDERREAAGKGKQMQSEEGRLLAEAKLAGEAMADVRRAHLARALVSGACCHS